LFPNKKQSLLEFIALFIIEVSFQTPVNRVSTTPGNPGNLLEFKNPPGNPGNLLEFTGPPGNFLCKVIDRIGFRS